MNAKFDQYPFVTSGIISYRQTNGLPRDDRWRYDRLFSICSLFIEYVKNTCLYITAKTKSPGQVCLHNSLHVLSPKPPN